jgi:LuxR family maltose regulon positive regulatory protein
MNSSSLIKTKLYAPLLGSDVISRRHLLNRLDYRRPLRLIVAPAGYGKTTLVCDWLEISQEPGVWLSLDSNDDSLSAFVTYLLAAIRTRYVDACPQTEALLNSPSAPAISVIANSLINELGEIPGRLVLVLDDYHTVTDLHVHQLMAELLHYQPNTLELVLIARHDPPLPLPAMRARNRVTEIRALELRLSSEELRQFMRQELEVELDSQRLLMLEKLTEGWPAGLRMAALFLQQQNDNADAHLLVDEGGKYGMEYLASEVLAHLSPGLQQFLLRTSVLEEMCAPLCAELIGPTTTERECQEHLDVLTERNLFVFSLKGQGRWYRYHHLFRKVLMHRAQLTLSEAGIRKLYEQAGRWLALHGRIEMAISHGVLAGSLQMVADLVRDHRNALMNSDDWARLETWRRLIPRTMIEAHPQLLILDAWSVGHQARIAELEERLTAVETLLARVPLAAEESRVLLGEIDAMRGQSTFWKGDIEAVLQSTERALDATPVDHAYPRALGWLHRTVALDMMGDGDAATAAMEQAFAEDDVRPIGRAASRAYIHACSLYWQRADMVHLNEYASRFVTLAQEYGMLERGAWARYFRGCARYQRNDLEGAAQDFAAGVETGYAAHPFAYSGSIVGLAATLQAQGQFDKAFETITTAVNHFRATEHEMLVARIEGFLAHLCFRQGRMGEAARWLAQTPRPRLPVPIPTFHSSEIVRAAVLLAQSDIESRMEAGESLAALRRQLEAQHNVRFLIEVYALQALWLWQSGAENEALELMERAVVMTVPGETLRVLADWDFMIGDLLACLGQRSSHRSQITRIRRAALVYRAIPPLPDNPTPVSQVAAHAAGTAGGEQRVRVRIPTLQEALTQREMDVLILLLDRPSNKEIAQQLSISVETVKRHMVNIFRKLQVENRRQAVVEAHRLGILSSS